MRNGRVEQMWLCPADGAALGGDGEQMSAEETLRRFKQTTNWLSFLKQVQPPSSSLSLSLSLSSSSYNLTTR